MKKIIVLGAGMIGRAIAIDLASRFDITVADISEESLMYLSKKTNQIKRLPVGTKLLDVTNETLLKEAIQYFDLVVCVVPGFLGFQTLKWILEAGKDVVDISFFPEDALQLKALAEANQVTAVVDCGVAPGMGNIILGYHNELMEISDFECLVGGLPKVKKWPFEYKAPFSPIDVIEEYTRPARYVENFQLVERPALSDPEYVEFEGVGTLESFNSDGLRSIIHTMQHIPNMKEKTLRYPGHIEYIQVLKSSGFFNTQPIKIREGVEVSPLDFTSKILFDEWKLGDTEEEITVMRITIRGKNESGNHETIVYHLHDKYDQVSQSSSMARTTGYTATGAVGLVMDGIFEEKGIFPPELVGKHEECFNYVMKHLQERGVIYRKETILE